MLTFFLNFLLGTFGTLAMFLILMSLTRESFSAPFFVIFLGLVCAILSMFFEYVSTFIILWLYAVASVMEFYNDRNN